MGTANEQHEMKAEEKWRKRKEGKKRGGWRVGDKRTFQIIQKREQGTLNVPVNFSRFSYLLTKRIFNYVP